VLYVGGGGYAICRQGATALSGGEISAGQLVLVQWDSVNDVWQIVGGAGGGESTPYGTSTLYQLTGTATTTRQPVSDGSIATRSFLLVNQDTSNPLYFGPAGVTSGSSPDANGGVLVAPNGGSILVPTWRGPVYVISDTDLQFSYTEWAVDAAGQSDAGSTLTQMTGTASTSATQVAPANSARVGFRLVDQDISDIIYWGDADVVSGITPQSHGGSPVQPNGGAVTIEGYTGAVYVICDTGTPQYSYTEW
jgi:hypothetical protein